MGNSNFNENTRVQVPAALRLCKLGYTYLDNIIAYDTKTNILIDVFLNAVKRLNPSMTSQEASLLFSKIARFSSFSASFVARETFVSTILLAASKNFF